MGRAEKYAHVLDDDNEYVLSSTREIKYKDIHDETLELEKEPTKEIIVKKSSIEEEKNKLRLKNEETFITKGDVFTDLLNRKVKNELKKDEIDINNINNEMADDNVNYIDSDFYGNNHKVVLVLLFILIILFLLLYLFLYPVIRDKVLISPNDVFNNFISDNFDNTIKNMSVNIDNDNIGNIVVGFYNNIETISLDVSEDKYLFVKNGNSYYFNNGDNNLYDFSDRLDEFSEIKDLFTLDNDIDISKFIKDKEYDRRFEKTTMIDKDYYLFRNTLKLQGDDAKRVFSVLGNSNILDDVNGNVRINIYTTLFNKFEGIDIEVNGFRIFYYYKIDNKFDVYFNLDLFNKIFETNLGNYLEFKGNIEKNNDIYFDIYINSVKNGDGSIKKSDDNINIKINGDNSILIDVNYNYIFNFDKYNIIKYDGDVISIN